MEFTETVEEYRKAKKNAVSSCSKFSFLIRVAREEREREGGRGVGWGTPIYELYRYVPLWRVWFSSSFVGDIGTEIREFWSTIGYHLPGHLYQWYEEWKN